MPLVHHSNKLIGHVADKMELDLKGIEMKIFFLGLLLLVCIALNCFADEEKKNTFEDDIVKLIADGPMSKEDKLIYTNFIKSKQSLSFDNFLGEYSKFSHLIKEYEPNSNEYKSSSLKLFCLVFLIVKQLEFKYSKITPYLDIFSFDFAITAFSLFLVEKLNFIGTADEKYEFNEKVLAKLLSADYRFNGDESLSFGLSIYYEQCIKKLQEINLERFNKKSKMLIKNMINNSNISIDVLLNILFNSSPYVQNNIVEFAEIPDDYFHSLYLGDTATNFSFLLEYYKTRVKNLESRLKIKDDK